MEINGPAQTIVTSGVIFASLVLLGRWVFEWFTKRVEEKDAQIKEMTADAAARLDIMTREAAALLTAKDEKIGVIVQALFEHTTASTHAINELVRTNAEYQKKMFAQHDRIIERIERLPMRGAT